MFCLSPLGDQDGCTQMKHIWEDSDRLDTCRGFWAYLKSVNVFKIFSVGYFLVGCGARGCVVGLCGGVLMVWLYVWINRDICIYLCIFVYCYTFSQWNPMISECSLCKYKVLEGMYVLQEKIPLRLTSVCFAIKAYLSFATSISPRPGSIGDMIIRESKTE